MKKNIILSLLILCCHTIFSQSSESIVIGEKQVINSKILNENRKIWVYNPAITALSKAPNKRYPVLYVLDGDAHFFSTVGIIQQLSQANGNGALPEMIVVGIENTNRMRDLIPALSSNANTVSINPFLRFISDELIPYIDKKYSTSSYKVLAGHSLGGLTTIDALASAPQSFNAYIAIDPSMWYNGEKILNTNMIQLSKNNFNGKKLFIGVANTLPKGVTLQKLKEDHTNETMHIRSIFKLDAFLNRTKNGLKYKQKYYEKETHNTAPLPTIYDGLRFIFDYYLFDATEKDFADTTTLIADKLKIHYAKVSAELGYQVFAPEDFINYIGYDALGKKQYSKAGALFALNIANYPNSSNVYDSYGDYCMAKKDTVSAIKNYQKSISISNNLQTQQKLNLVTGNSSYKISTEQLRKYVGGYTLESYNITITLELKEGKLYSKVPGQADTELLPISKDVFTVKEKQGYTITFEMNNDKPVSFTSVQPNGVFKALFKG